MSAPSIPDLIGRHVANACRIQLRHERSRTFRPWGILELLLTAAGYVALLPLWIYLALTALYVAVDGDGDGGSGSGSGDGDGAPKQRRAKSRKFAVSPLFHCHHDVVVRVLGADGAVLAETRARPRSETEGRQLVASVLRVAQASRLTVVETVGLEGVDDEGPNALAHVWHGGRPLMSPPDLRRADDLAVALRDKGFELVVEPTRAVLRRTYEPGSIVSTVLPPLLLVGLMAIGFVINPLYVLFLPAILFVLWLYRRQVAAILWGALCSVLRLRERHALVLSAHDASYSFRHAWRRLDEKSDGDDLVAVGHLGTLTYDDEVQRESPRLAFVGKAGSFAVPARFSQHAGALVHDWVLSTLLRLRQDNGVHDWRSRCAYCATLVDFDAANTCAHCGAPPLAA